MPYITRSLIVALSTLSLAACSHDAQMAMPSAPTAHYALQSQKGAEAVTTPGFVSRYQREVIVTGTNIIPSSPAAAGFDEAMTALEALMAPQIAENNRIAALQEQIPGYRF